MVERFWFYDMDNGKLNTCPWIIRLSGVYQNRLTIIILEFSFLIACLTTDAIDVEWHETAWIML